MRFQSRKFTFRGCPHQSLYAAEVDFVESRVQNTCTFCSARENVLTLFVRLVVQPIGHSRFPGTRQVNNTVFRMLPHGTSFCPRHSTDVERAINAGIQELEATASA